MSENILILSHNSFSDKSNNGKTLESIFLKFSKFNLFQIFFRYIEPLDYSYCENYLYLTPQKLFFNPSNFNSDKKLNQNSFVNFLNKNISIKYLLIDIYWKLFFNKSKFVLEWCIENKINAIFFMAGPSQFSHSLAIKLKQKLDIPLFVYFTDDYLIHPLRNNLVEKFQYLRLKKIYNKTILHSSLNFCIGEDMCVEYSEYFKKNFLPLMNSVDFINYPLPKDNQEFIISFFGSLHSNRWMSIIKFSKIIKKFSLQNDLKFQIKIYTNTVLSQNILEELLSNSININEPVYENDFFEKIICSDLLLHCESDNEIDKANTMLSVSTKIPEYCMTKRPIIAYGPNEVSSMKLLTKHNIAYVLDSNSNNEINFLVLKDLLKYENRINIAEKAFNYVIKNHNKDIVSSNFKNCITKEIKNFYDQSNK
jgi:hypothetical protein